MNVGLLAGIFVLGLAVPGWAGDYTVTLTSEEEALALWAAEHQPKFQSGEGVSPTVQGFLNAVVDYGLHVSGGDRRIRDRQRLEQTIPKMTPAERAQLEALQDAVEGRTR